MTRLYTILNQMLNRTKKVDASGEFSITRTTGGTVSDLTAQKVGPLVFLQFRVTYSTAVASGGNVFTGTLTTGTRPTNVAYSCSYINASPCICSLNPTGSIVLRNASPVNVTATAGIGVSFIYAIDG